MTSTRRPECASSLAARSRLDDLTDPLDDDYRSWWPHGAPEYQRQVKALAAWVLAALPSLEREYRVRRRWVAEQFSAHDRMAGDALWWLEDLGLLRHQGAGSPYYLRSTTS